MAYLNYQSDQWSNLLESVVTDFEDGETIKHEWLRDKFGIKMPTVEDYPVVEELIKAIDMQQFEYMTLVERMKEDLLKQYQVCIKNERGVGYRKLLPKEQTTYGYDKLNDDIAKAMRTACLITSNVRNFDDFAQRSKDNDLRAKIGSMKTFMSSIR